LKTLALPKGFSLSRKRAGEKGQGKWKKEEGKRALPFSFAFAFEVRP
jgi:hypothetical protein